MRGKTAGELLGERLIEDGVDVQTLAAKQESHSGELIFSTTSWKTS